MQVGLFDSRAFAVLFCLARIHRGNHGSICDRLVRAHLMGGRGSLRIPGLRPTFNGDVRDVTALLERETCLRHAVTLVTARPNPLPPRSRAPAAPSPPDRTSCGSP